MNYRNLTIKVGNVDKIDHSITTLQDVLQRGTVLPSDRGALLDMVSILEALKRADAQNPTLTVVRSTPPPQPEETEAVTGRAVPSVALSEVQEYPRQKLNEQQVISASRESIAAMSRLVSLRPVARELKHQTITEEEYHALPPAVKAAFTLVDAAHMWLCRACGCEVTCRPNGELREYRCTNRECANRSNSPLREAGAPPPDWVAVRVPDGDE